MLHAQIILQYFYKILMRANSYWFSFSPIINITFLFINNYSPQILQTADMVNNY